MRVVSHRGVLESACSFMRVVSSGRSFMRVVSHPGVL